MLAALLALGALVVPASAAAEGRQPRPAPPRSDELVTPGAGAAGATKVRERPTPLPKGTRVLPEHRVVAFWGSPQLTRSILGRLNPAAAGRKLRSQAADYQGKGRRPVVRAFELVATIATADDGRDGRYRFRQPERVIETYLRAARRAGARLILDIQPGRSPFMTEVRALRRWLREPDVDVALDPEWNVGRRGVPGRTRGAVRAGTINDVASYLSRLTVEEGLPQKLLVVHQFRSEMIPDRQRLRGAANVALTLNFDGIGTAREKAAGYRRLSSSRLFNGFSLFYRLDRGLMSPRQVFRLRPSPDYLLYQ